MLVGLISAVSIVAVVVLHSVINGSFSWLCGWRRWSAVSWVSGCLRRRRKYSHAHGLDTLCYHTQNIAYSQNTNYTLEWLAACSNKSSISGLTIHKKRYEFGFWFNLFFLFIANNLATTETKRVTSIRPLRFTAARSPFELPGINGLYFSGS